MSIIYFNIEKWKKSKRKAVEGEGTTDEEIALSVISKVKEKNEYIHEGKLVLYFEDILPEIVRQYSNRDFFQEQYWNENAGKDCQVYCMVEDVVLSFDYFLHKSKLLNEDEKSYYYQVNEKNCEFPEILKMKLLFSGNNSKKVNNQDLIHDIAVLEKLDLGSWDSDSLKNFLSDDLIDRLKKQLFYGKYSVKKRIERIFDMDFKKFNKNSRSDMLMFIFWIYYMDRHGIISKDEAKKLGILDAMEKPRIQMISDYRIHDKEVEAARNINMLKNILARNVEYEKLVEIERVIKKTNDFYSAVFNYIARVLQEDMDSQKKQLELENMSSRVEKAIAVVDKVKNIEKDKKYEMTVWEMAYFRYKAFMEVCRKTDSVKSLEYVLGMEAPNNTKFFDTCLDEKLRYAEVPICNLGEFIRENAEYIALHVASECDTEWIENNIKRVFKYYKILHRFNATYEYNSCPLTMLISMYQVIYKLEKQKLKYDNNYKNYKGNKKISILAKLDSDEINSDGDVFNYILIALLKKWFHYNEYNYEQWKAKSQMEVLFESMINKIMSLDSIIDIETVVEGLYVEFAFPETSYILDIKESREKEFYEKTGYKLDIQEYGMIRDFQKQEYFDWFVEQMKVVIVLNEERNKQEVFHLNQEYVSLELYQDIENKVITFIRCKYLALGDSFDLYYRALQLELPWFTDHFWNF